MSGEEEEKKSQDKVKGRKHRTSGFEEWGGYMASKKMKLAAQFSGQRDMEAEDREEVRSDIFKDISIYVNGYTKPTAEELKRLMMIHGGTYHYYLSSKTTHTIASNLPYSKVKNLKNQVVVKPEWIIDSIKAGKLLPHQNYFLYPPELTHKQPRLNFENFTESKSTSTIYDAKSSHSIFPQGASKSGDSTNNEEFIESWDTVDFNYKTAYNSSSAISAKTFPNSPSKNESPVTAGHPAFLSEFYSHSRLHHISTAGQELKRYVQTLVDNHGSKPFPARENLKSLVKAGHLPKLQKDFVIPLDGTSEKKQRVVMHLDMDCFFVSVGLRKYPELKGKPVAVTHSKGKRGGAQDGSDLQYEASHYKNQSKQKIEGVASTAAEQNFSDEDPFDDQFIEKPKISKYSKEYGSLSEIASCSYEARKFGLRNGMFLGEALRRCPDLKTIPYDFEGYSEVSKLLYDIVASYTLDIEAVSCDELYIDCTELLQETGLAPLQFSTHLRSEIEEKTKCTASAGLGSNMLLARLANKAAKPNGQYYVTNECVDEFMRKQNVRDLPGVGYSISAKFERMGVFTCDDLQKWSLTKLQQEFGPKTGQTFYKRCRGKDNRTVQLQKERKSVSAEINYGIRFEKEEDVFRFLKELSVEVVNRLNNINCKAKCITLKLMVRHPDAPVQTAKFMGHGVCDHIVKSVSLKSATNDSLIIGHECCMLARTLKIKPEDYRGVGIQLSKLEQVQKDNRGFRSIESFICSDIINEESQSPVEKFSIQQNKSDSAQKDPRSFKDIESYICNNVINGELGNHANKVDHVGRPESILKDSSSFKNIESLICPDIVNGEPENHVNKEIFAPKELEPVYKPLPKGASIKDYLSDKTSPNKVQKQVFHPEASSVDQLDQSFLNALPEDLQKEILDMYSTKSFAKSASSAQHSSTSSHSNHSVPSKSSKHHPKKGIQANVNKNKIPSKQNTLLDCMMPIRNHSIEDKEEESVLKKKASIGGAENINEVRSLVKEWVLSSQVVLDEDIDQFRDFILQVIDEDLKKVDLILKYFHRVVSTANTLWQQAYLTILSYVQQKMLQKYGTMLEAKSDFST